MCAVSVQKPTFSELREMLQIQSSPARSPRHTSCWPRPPVFLKKKKWRAIIDFECGKYILDAVENHSPGRRLKGRCPKSKRRPSQPCLGLEAKMSENRWICKTGRLHALFNHANCSYVIISRGSFASQNEKYFLTPLPSLGQKFAMHQKRNVPPQKKIKAFFHLTEQSNLHWGPILNLTGASDPEVSSAASITRGVPTGHSPVRHVGPPPPPW